MALPRSLFLALYILIIANIVSATSEAANGCTTNANSAFQTCPLQSSQSTGAVCLDGSPYMYFLRPSTTGSTKWIIYFMGGGWCWNETDCLSRSLTALGSSSNWSSTEPAILQAYGGVFSQDPKQNPMFHDWNFLELPYCDGASFSGDVTNGVVVKGAALYMRGHRIMQQSIKQASSLNGLSKATELVVSGCSAGGLATYLHVDEIAAMFPKARVSGLSDSGYFINMPDVQAAWHIQSQYSYVYKMQNSSFGVDKDCVAAYQPQSQNDRTKTWQCFFAQYTYPFIKTPTFVQNSLVDLWQALFIVAPEYEASLYWWGCRMEELKGCTTDQLFAAQTLYEEMVDSLRENGVTGYLNSCITHVIAMGGPSWNATQINGIGQIKALQQWYQNPSTYTSLYDAPPPFGCNPN